MKYNRFIALGDSMTEGMSDEQINGLYRGWADRTAEVMATNWPGFSYANFAVRGKLVGQVVNDQIPMALPFIEGKSTLVSFHAGANDFGSIMIEENVVSAAGAPHRFTYRSIQQAIRDAGFEPQLRNQQYGWREIPETIVEQEINY